MGLGWEYVEFECKFWLWVPSYDLGLLLGGIFAWYLLAGLFIRLGPPNWLSGNESEETATRVLVWIFSPVIVVFCLLALAIEGFLVQPMRLLGRVLNPTRKKERKDGVDSGAVDRLG